MRYRGIVFDADGTLLDSMPMWQNFGREYLLAQGKNPHPDVDKDIQPMSFAGAAEYFRTEYGVDKPVDEIVADFNRIVEQKYRFQIQPKPGALALMKKLKALSVKMCVATSTESHLVRLALERLGMMPYLVDCISCGDYHTSKNEPFIFKKACELMGTGVEESVVFEDSLHCIVTAKRAGFHVVCVADDFTAAYENQLRELSDYYLTRLDDFGWMDCE